MTIPGALELLTRHIEDHAVVIWVPDADLLGSAAPTSCQNDGIGIGPEEEKRTAESGRLQPVPIESAPFGLEPQLIREFDQA